MRVQRAPAGAVVLGCESRALSFAVAQNRWSLAPRLWQCTPLLLVPEDWKSLRFAAGTPCAGADYVHAGAA
jgi:hypothetical protein